MSVFIFFFNDTATTEIYTLSLHDALPISGAIVNSRIRRVVFGASDPLRGGCGSMLDIIGHPDHLYHVRCTGGVLADVCAEDRKSTRLNSSHANISYAVFCLKKKK